MPAVMRGMAGYAYLSQGGIKHRTEAADRNRKEWVISADKRKNLTVERDDPVLPGSSLHAAAEILVFHIDFQFSVGGDPEAAVYHDKDCLQQLVPVRMLPDEGKFLFREGFPFFVIVGRVDPDMFRVFPLAQVMGVGIVVHLPEKVYNMLFCGMLFRAVVNYCLKIFGFDAAECYYSQPIYKHDK